MDKAKELVNHYDALLGRAKKMYGARCEDVVQDACVMILSQKGYDPVEGRSTYGSFNFALRKAASLEAFDFMKHQHSKLSDADDQPVYGGQEEMCDAKTLIAAVDARSIVTGDMFRMMLMGYNFREIGERHDMSKQGVAKHLDKAKKIVADIAS